MFEGSKDSRAQLDSKVYAAFKVYLEAKETEVLQVHKELKDDKVLLDCQEVRQDGRDIRDLLESQVGLDLQVQMVMWVVMVQQVQQVQMDILVVTEP